MTMTVGELVAELQKCDQSKFIFFWNDLRKDPKHEDIKRVVQSIANQVMLYPYHSKEGVLRAHDDK